MSTDSQISGYIEFITSTIVPCIMTTFFLYGLYSLLFCIYVQMQIRNSRSHRHHRPIFFRLSIPALFFLITLNVILWTISTYELLRSQTLMDWVSGRQSLAEPDAHYFGFWNFGLAAAAVLIVASTMADALLLYRTYTLWDFRVSIVIAPVILILSSIGAGLYAIIMCGKASKPLITDLLAGNTILKDAEIGMLAFVCSTLVTNLSLIGLIVYRVRQMSQITNKYLPSSEHVNNKSLVRLIIGSCLLYPLTIATICGEVIGVGTDVTFVLPIAAQMMGISPTFLIVEIDLALNNSTNGLEIMEERSIGKAENSHTLAPSNIQISAS
ncbi:hypothetical protein GYMLUDRAFT_41427 [Collybiopsis luxurians FD-317 M1]|uniref:Uncharacterized protein n=1 Tax=Collybiopsis luxurians FD-317 M1 TaxID=944289 RepID=A0A0D0CUC4_9AGAR|nr:hypothetical protein GYMLUDRAFT_41427 [Collybiopsis luxurians FD-317 M1]